MTGACAIPALLIGLAAVTAAQDPVIRVPVRLVNVPTLVFSSEHKLLTGLQAGNFRVSDNGRTQRASLNYSAAPISVVIALQTNADVRSYLPFLARTGSVIDTLLVGESGEAAVIAYDNYVSVLKNFDGKDVQPALRKITASGTGARLIDAGLRGVSLLAQRPPARSRVLLLIGQSGDSGSESSLDALRESALKENVAVYCLALPQAGRAFVSDTFSLQGVSKQERGGYRAGIDLRRLMAVLDRSGAAAAGADPFTVLTAATGGTQIHFKTQLQVEEAIGVIGVALRSAYLVTYYPNAQETGYHSVKVEVDVPGAKVYARPGYWM